MSLAGTTMSLAQEKQKVHEIFTEKKPEALQNSTLGCESLTHFAQTSTPTSPLSQLKNETRNLFLKNQKCLEAIKSKSQDLSNFEKALHNTPQTSINLSEDFFQKCIREKKLKLNKEETQQLILSFYLNSFTLRRELLKTIEDHSSFSRLQGNTSFHKSRPYPNNFFQREQIQKINDLAKCSPQDARAYEIAFEIKDILDALKETQPLPKEILETYPLLKDKEIQSLLSSKNLKIEDVGRKIILSLEKSQKQNLLQFESNQLALQCLYNQNSKENCLKSSSPLNILKENNELFLMNLSKIKGLESCAQETNSQTNDPCLSKKSHQKKLNPCETELMPAHDKEYRLCKANTVLSELHLKPISSSSVDSFDKNILNDKRSIMGQKWSNLLFIHYKVDPKELQKLIPPPLELDLHNNEAWVSVVPFKMTEVRPGNIANITPSFPEINVRTYVKYGEQHGVYFLTLDANNKLVVKTSSLFPGLPYKQAEMNQSGEGSAENPFYMKSNRKEKNAPSAAFEANYEVKQEKTSLARDELSRFLVERYRFFGVNKDGCVVKTDINHAKWPIKTATATIKQNTMLDSIPQIKVLNQEPIVNYVEEMDVKVWAPKEVGCEKLD